MPRLSTRILLASAFATSFAFAACADTGATTAQGGAAGAGGGSASTGGGSGGSGATTGQGGAAGAGGSGITFPELRSAVPHAPPYLSKAEQAQAIADAQAFAFDLYHQVALDPARAGKSIILSPLSISIALSMTAAGAKGATLDGMRQALRVTQPEPLVDDGWNWLATELAARPAQGLATLAPGLSAHMDLTVVNVLFAQKEIVPVAAFLDTLSAEYDAGIELVDFYADPAGSRQSINAWVADRTSHRIEDLLPAAVVTKKTKFVLVNAISMGVPWASSFWMTADKDFTRLDGTTVKVPMMWQGAIQLPFTATADLSAAALPLLGGQLEAVIVLPDAGKFASVEASLDGASFAALRASLAPTWLEPSFPKLRVAPDSLALKPELEALGMASAFDVDAADFSGLTTTWDLHLVDVIHKAMVAFDQGGIEAAAATGVVGAGGSAGPPPGLPFVVDRPFLFAIRDRTTGALLFWGRITVPE